MQQKILENIKQTLSLNMPEGGKAYLYGSRARGDNRSDSDWDILLLLDEQDDEGKPLYALMKLGWETNQNISPISYTKDEWKKYSFTPFYHNVTDEGILIYGSN
ncbi:MAG: nucleotidyltransferase domain-containing protein [Bacteroidaceae bacterium]|nr:nucleotidyltransferase domain-containing protein [Bacteroidaceae bacterium]